jgi:hypothetical protein
MMRAATSKIDIDFIVHPRNDQIRDLLDELFKFLISHQQQPPRGRPVGPAPLK